MPRPATRFLLHVCRAIGLFRFARWLTRGAVCVLGYRGTWRMADGSPGDAYFIRPETFLWRLDWLQQQGYPIRSLHQVVEALSSGRPLPARVVVITIDDGWYGTYADMLPALEARRIPATLYCDTAHLHHPRPVPQVLARCLRDRHDTVESSEAREVYRTAIDRTRSLTDRDEALATYAALMAIDLEPYLQSEGFRYMTPTHLRDLHQRGIDVELHSHHHTLHDFSPARIREEIERNRAELAAILGEAHVRTHFCFPDGDTDVRAGDVLREVGVLTAVTNDSGLVRYASDRYHLPRYLDGDQITPIEFEAWVSGFSDLAQQGASVLHRLRRRVRPRHDGRSRSHPMSDMPSGRNRGFASPPASS